MVGITSKRLKGLMAEHGITVREFSKRIGISEKSLSLKIGGRREWMYWELILIAKQFGFSEVRKVFPELYEAILQAG
jgi:transcriptional regulator with XRE-family HTH domain